MEIRIVLRIYIFQYVNKKHYRLQMAEIIGRKKVEIV